jgi:TolB-like protein/tetratricopeptide (TPR) repeat protein
MNGLWSELRRREVFKAIGIYAAAAFVLVQAADIVFPALGLPPRAMTVLVIVAIAGAPVTCVLAWLFDVTSQGVMRDDGAADPSAPAAAPSVQLVGRRTTLIVGVGVGALCAGFLGLAGYMTMRGSQALEEAEAATGASRIAVLPLKVLGPDTSNAYLAEGLTEELIGALARVEGVAVLARSTVYSYEGTEQDARDLGRDLGVSSILSGSITSVGDELRVAAQVVDVSTGLVSWSQTFKGSVQEVFAIQDSITTAVISHFSGAAPGTRTVALARTTESEEAYRLYLEGRFFWNKRNAQAIGTAIDRFNRALKVDPDYAKAYVGLADALIALSQFGIQSPAVVMPQAVSASRRALELGVNEAEIYNTAAHVAELNDRDWARAEQLYLRALGIDRDFATGHAWYGDLLMSRGREAEALDQMQVAARLEPLSAPILFQLATTHLRLGHLEEAEKGYLRILEMDPAYISAVVYLAYTYMELKDGVQAVSYIDRAIQASGGHPGIVACRVMILARLGRLEEARADLAGLAPKLVALDTAERAGKSAPAYVSDLVLAGMYANLGDADRAMERLDKLVASRGNVMFLARDPWWSPLRADPRFVALLAKLDIPSR